MNADSKTTGAIGGAGAGAGAALLAGVASACCVGPVTAPLIVGILGAGGAAWAASLKPYSPYLLAGSGLLLGYALWMLYRPRSSCSMDETAHGGSSRRLRSTAVGVTWTATALWATALILNLTLS